MSKPYTEKQIEAANLIRSVSADVSDEVVNHIVELLGDTEASEQPSNQTEDEDAIKVQLLYERDWRKRAALSAMLISKGLK